MKLLSIGGPGRAWTVFMTKEVLEFLNDWGQAKQPKVSMTSFLLQSVPLGGPQESNPIVCKPVKGSDGLFYFRKGKRHGEKVRVFWFYGATRLQVVCAWGCVKTQEKLEPEDIRMANSLRGAYRTDLENGELSITDGVPLLRGKR